MMRSAGGWVVLMLICTAAAFGQGRSSGMHGAYATLATGAEAPFYNPANLAFTPGRQTTLSLLGVSGWLADNAFGLEEYRRYNGAYLDRAAKRDILSAVTGRGLLARAGVTARPLAIAVGPAALSWQTRAVTRFSLADELFRLLLEGNEVDKTYDFVPAAGRAMLLSDLTLSWGYSPPFTIRGIHSLSFGANAHYFIGSFYGQVEQMRARALTGATLVRAEGKASMRTAQGGGGWGLDLGMTAVINRHLRCAFFGENIVNEISWNKQSERIAAGFTLNATNVDRILQEDLELEEVVLHSDTTLAIPAFSIRLPRRYHLSGSYLQKRWSVSAEWVGGEAGGGEWGGSEVALGGEFSPWRFLWLRGGAGRTEELGWSSSLGFGLQMLGGRWDFAWQGVGSLHPGRVRGALVATSLYLIF